MLGPGLTACCFLPPGNRMGTWRPGSLQPCQESPGGPAGVLGEAQGGPSLSPQSLPDPARHRGRKWPWNHPQLLELTAPTAGPARALWGTAGRAALAAGDSHCCIQDCSSPECSPGTALPCRARGHCQPCSPCGSSRLSPAPAGSSRLLHCPDPEPCLCHTSGRASTAGTPRGRNVQRGSKPYNTTARHPSEAWRGRGEQGVHVINIKSATKRRHILYIFDPYTQEHNIHRTPRSSGDVVRRFLRDAAPLRALPTAGWGCTHRTSVTKSSTGLAHGIPGVCGWSGRGPRRACPAALGER